MKLFKIKKVGLFQKNKLYIATLTTYMKYIWGEGITTGDSWMY